MVDSTVDSTLDNAEWLSLADAARTLGVSEKTARRRAKAGQLEARQVSTQHGPAWQVRVPTRVDSRVDTKSRVDSTVPMGTQAQPADVAALVGLVDRLTAENRELVNAVAAWQSQAVVLAGRLADAEERLALTAPSTPVEASTATAAAQAAPEALPSGWWRRWRAWLAAGLVVAVLGSASCQTIGVAVRRPNICSAAQQHLAVSDRLAGVRRGSAPEGRWITSDEWQDLSTVAAFLTTYC